MDIESAIIVRDKTRLEQLIERFNSKAQAKFYIERSGADFELYEQEHAAFYSSMSEVEKGVAKYLKSKVVERSFLPTYLFSEKELVLVIGQDGLVANTAKYVGGQPILAINPDPASYEGVLLPYIPGNFETAIKACMAGTQSIEQVTMAEALMNDGQRLLAFNDFYIGASSHVSSRYCIKHKGREEYQSSSGVLVATGAGSTGWLSSVFNMANNIRHHFAPNAREQSITMRWGAEQLMYVVREPYASVNTQVGIGFGKIDRSHPLIIESHMAGNGVIFSDGIEADHIKFNTGSTVQIMPSAEKAFIIKL